MKYIIGMGNDDKKYQDTRHNIGFEVVSRMAAQKWDYRESWQAWVNRLNEKVSLVKSKLFVNHTGQTVSAMVAGSHVSPENILVVCDDVNLEFGKLRLRNSGSAGGHHGLESIIGELGSEDFPRLRVGIRNDQTPKEVTNFVLEPFNTQEKKTISQIVDNAAVVCQVWAEKGFEAALNQVSRLQSQSKELRSE